MTEKFRFFNSVEGDPREYQADEFAEYFRTFLTSGVFNGENALKITAEGSTMNSIVDSGYAFIKGYLYKNDDVKILTHSAADAFQDRIDRIVIRLDMLNRNILTVIKEGVKSDNPIVPDVERTDTIYEISLAKVRIIAGKSYIDQSQITDERLNEELCGYVSSLVTIPTNEMWNDWIESKGSISSEWSTWFNNAQNEYSQMDLVEFRNDLDNHTTNRNNPHVITPGQIGAETPTGSQNKATVAENNAKAYADNVASETETTAKTYASAVATQAETNSKNYTNTHEAKSNPLNITGGLSD